MAIEERRSGRLRIVVAGQVPPPVGGQNLMIERILEILMRETEDSILFWEFDISRNWQSVRKLQIGKVRQLLKALARLFLIRAKGPIDCLLYPIGGPHTGAIARDAVLFTAACALARCVILHFHAAGIADRLAHLGSIRRSMVRMIYRRAQSGLVMTEFGRRDPAALEIQRTSTIPNTVPDVVDKFEASAAESDATVSILYVGHLCEDKGTPSLVEAFSRLRRSYENVRLLLIGETLQPYSDDELIRLIEERGLKGCIELAGLKVGRVKWEYFKRASLCVFPSVAPYESFGLVLIEAMMWSLPIVATRWRGAAEVLGDPPGGLLFDPGGDLADAIGYALVQAIERRSEWSRWGSQNRSLYLNSYTPERVGPKLAKYIISEARMTSGTPVTRDDSSSNG